MRSLNTSFDEMRSLVCDLEFDVFGVTETWLHPDTPSDNYSIPGFNMLRYDRHADSAEAEVGGGVAIYIKQGILYEQHLLADDIDPGIEYLCVVLRVKGVRIGVCVGYRPSYVRYTSLTAFFHSLFVDLAVQVNHVIYLGDTNIDLISRSGSDKKFLRRLLTELNVNQIINEPTRVTAHSATLLDHIIVDRSVKFERTGVVDAPSITDYRGVKMTDHKLIYCILKVEKEKTGPKLISYRDFSRFDINEVVPLIAKVKWGNVGRMQDVNDIETFITSNIKKIYNEHAPVVCKRVTKRKAPWRNDEIKKLTKAKNKMRNIFWKTRDSTDWGNYKQMRNKLNGLIRRAKIVYYNEKLALSNNPKEFWRSLKQSGITEKNNDYALPPDVTVDKINEFFVQMGSDVDVNADTVNYFVSTHMNNIGASFCFTTVTEDEVKSAINEIKSGAVGTDGISIYMVKAVSPFALGAITHLINTSLLTGSFPRNWKMSVVHPLPKVSTPSDVKHLRPISILPAMSKVLEKIVIRQLAKHIKDNSILPSLQSGFRENHSTCTALVNMFSDLLDAKDKGRCSCVVMLDYSQAFDSINHDLMVAKLKYYSFGNNIISWIRSYLEQRLQITKHGSDTSLPLAKLRGVPQGSCLGPILFNLYTSDFPRCVQNCSAHLYADDCQLHLSYEPGSMIEAVDKINSDLCHISQWSLNNGLKLNIDKCTVLHVAPQNVIQALSQNNLQVALCGEGLTVCDKVKTLGVILDSGLTFSDHVTYATQRAFGRLRGLNRFRNLLPASAKLQLMQSLILSVFYYCYPAYGNSISRGDAYRIQKAQNSAIRFIYCLKRSDHVSPFRDAAGFATMDAVCRRMTCCMIHKVLRINEPHYLSERLIYREEASQRSTRQDRRLHFPKVRLEVGRRSFSYYGPKLYNDLPNNVKGYSLPSFKAKIIKCYP